MGLRMTGLQALERAEKHPPKDLKCEGLDCLLFPVHEREVLFPLDIESCQEKMTSFLCRQKFS